VIEDLLETTELILRKGREGKRRKPQMGEGNGKEKK